MPPNSATRWKFIRSFTDGERFEFLPGHNIWDHVWTSVLRDPAPAPTGDEWKNMVARYETAEVPDPLYGGTHTFRVYETKADGRAVRFAASEFSNTVWGYLLPDESTP
jgi:hypothetical protein